MLNVICVCGHVVAQHRPKIVDDLVDDHAGNCDVCDCQAFFAVAQPTMTISLARKIQTAPYENAEVFASVSGVRAGMTPEDLAPLLSTGKIAYDDLRAVLAEQIRETIAAVDARTL